MSSPLIIPLRSWQDPQGDIILIYSEHECSIYFGCWLTAGEPADYICRLSFKRSVAVRSFRREFLPYQLPPHSHHSYIIRIEDSDFQREHIDYRRQHYPRFQYNPSDHTHFIVTGHDIYHELLAQTFEEATIPISELTDERLLELAKNT